MKANIRRQAPRLPLSIVFGAACASLQLAAVAAVQTKEPQKRPGTYADVHAQQGVGRVIASSDGKFVVYEWGRPYLNWAPETKWMAPGAAKRLETFLYTVDLDEPDTRTSSEFLFYPNAGCSYWLGDLSADNKHLVVYELSHDDRRVRAGFWSVETKKMQWLTPRADEARIEEGGAWISNDEFLYPIKGGGAVLAKASVVTNMAEPCPECSRETVRMARQNNAEADAHVREIAARVKADDVPKDAVLMAGAGNGSLAIYVRDNKGELSMYYKKPEYPVQTLFTNRREWVPFEVPAKVAGNTP